MSRQKILVCGYEGFIKAMQHFKKKDLVYCYFSGDKDRQTGQSWCANCNHAEPFVMAAFEKYSKPHATFVLTEVGNQSAWHPAINQGTYNMFRTDKYIRLGTIPTLMRWRHAWRLEGSFCAHDKFLEMFFSKHSD